MIGNIKEALRKALPEKSEYELWEDPMSRDLHFNATETRSGYREVARISRGLDPMEPYDVIGQRVRALVARTQQYEAAWAQVPDADTWWIE